MIELSEGAVRDRFDGGGGHLWLLVRVAACHLERKDIR